MTNIRKKYIFLIPLFLCISGISAPLSQSFPKSRNLPVVVLDPGHGGTSNGAMGANSLSEKSITLRLAMELSEILKDSCTVLLTRESDINPETDKRAEIANSANAALFISLHTGGGFSQGPGPLRILHSTSPKAPLPPDLPLWLHGQIHYAHQSARLAQILAETLRQTLPAKKSIVIETRNLPLLTPLTMPAILLEVGNLSAPQDALWLKEADAYQKISQALAQAIRNYLAADF